MPKKKGCGVLFAVLVSAMLIAGICLNAAESAAYVQDNAPPTTSHDYDGAWHTSDFTINLTAIDSSGISETYYRINGGPIQNISRDGQPRITMENGNNTLEYWNVDNAGNQETPKMLTEIKLDKTKPIGTLKINDGAASTISNQVTLTISAEDATSGVAQMRFFEVVYGNWEEYATSKFWVFNTTGEGYKTVYVQVRDKAGLVSAARNATIWLGSNPPGPWIGVDPPLTPVPEKTPSEKLPEKTPSEKLPETPSETISPIETAPPEISAPFPLWLVIIAAVTIGIVIAAAPTIALLRLKRKMRNENSKS
jgi:hypothetical protein